MLFDPAAGQLGGGERGTLSLPGPGGRSSRTASTAALASASLLGTKRLNAIAGVCRPVSIAQDAERTAIANLQAAPLAAARRRQAAGREHQFDRDARLLHRYTGRVRRGIVEAVDHASVKFQLDQYHVGMMGLDPLAALHELASMIEHVQIADVPGRHEPGTGQQPIAEFLRELDAVGYGGSVGLEYRPGDHDGSRPGLAAARRPLSGRSGRSLQPRCRR